MKVANALSARLRAILWAPPSEGPEDPAAAGRRSLERARGFIAAGLALAVFLAPAALLAAQAPPTAEELVRRIQARQQTIRDFTARFTEQVSSPLLPKASAEEGELKVKRPGRLSLVYTTGDRNEYWADGTTLRSYFKRDRFGTLTTLPADDEAPTWMSFLAGRGDLARDFSARLAESQPANEWRLILSPRQPTASFQSLELQVDRKTLQLRGLVVVDAQGTTNRYRFSNLRENVGLSDQAFQFEFPKGVDVRRQ